MMQPTRSCERSEQGPTNSRFNWRHSVLMTSETDLTTNGEYQKRHRENRFQNRPDERTTECRDKKPYRSTLNPSKNHFSTWRAGQRSEFWMTNDARDVDDHQNANPKIEGVFHQRSCSPLLPNPNREIMVQNRREIRDRHRENLDKALRAGKRDSLLDECYRGPHVVHRTSFHSKVWVQNRRHGINESQSAQKSKYSRSFSSVSAATMTAIHYQRDRSAQEEGDRSESSVYSRRNEIRERYSIYKSENSHLFLSKSKSFLWRSSDSMRRVDHRGPRSMLRKYSRNEVWIPNKKDEIRGVQEAKANKELQLRMYKHRKMTEQYHQNNENGLTCNKDDHVKKNSSPESDTSVNNIKYPQPFKYQAKPVKGLPTEKVNLFRNLQARLSVNSLDCYEIQPAQSNSQRVLEWLEESVMLESCEDASEKSERELSESSKERYKLKRQPNKMEANDESNGKNSAPVLTTATKACECKQNRCSNATLPSEKNELWINQKPNKRTYLEPVSSDDDISEKRASNDFADASVKEGNFANDSNVGCACCNLTIQKPNENVRVLQPDCVVHYGSAVNGNSQVCSNKQTCTRGSSSGFNLNHPLRPASPKAVLQCERTVSGNHQVRTNPCTWQPRAMYVSTGPLRSLGSTQSKCFSQCERAVNENCQPCCKFHASCAKNVITESVLSCVSQCEKRTNACCQLCDSESRWQPILVANGIPQQYSLPPLRPEGIHEHHSIIKCSVNGNRDSRYLIGEKKSLRDSQIVTCRTKHVAEKSEKALTDGVVRVKSW